MVLEWPSFKSVMFVSVTIRLWSVLGHCSQHVVVVYSTFSRTSSKCRDWLVQPISVYGRMCIRPAAKSFLLRVLHMRSGYKSHSGVASKLVDCCFWSVSLPFVVVAGVCYVLALLSRVVRKVSRSSS